MSLPTSLLRVSDLLYRADQAADDVLSGRWDHLLPEGGVPTERRWFTRVHRDDQLDLWLCSWVPGDPTGLHDHGSSLGALTVVSGRPNEFRWDGTRLRRRRLNAGDQAGFPLGCIHDVAGEGLSVHAYSLPLTTMNYFTLRRGTLRRIDGPRARPTAGSSRGVHGLPA
jgi:hypothetical protein